MLWLWIGGTKEIGTLETEENPLDTGGFAAIEGKWLYKGLVERKQ